MRIEVVKKRDSPEKEKGDLLESLAENILSAQNFEVVTEIQLTGVEVDLLCQHKANHAREIYVECKAYKDNSLIQSDVIRNLSGTMNIKGYKEAWLISTTDFGKSAKGLIKEISEGPNAAKHTFYSPAKVIDALVDSNVIVSPDVANHVFLTAVAHKERVGKTLTLLVSTLGIFWAIEYLEGGVPVGLLFVHAGSGKLVSELALLQNISLLNTSFSKLDHNISIYLEVQGDGGTQVVPSVDAMKLTPEYLKRISEIGLSIRHPNTDNLTLDDIFVFPDLEDTETPDAPYISSSSILDNIDLPKKVLIFGSDVSGKTSLAHAFQKQCSLLGKISIYINAADVSRSDHESFLKLLKKSFAEQYGKSPLRYSLFEKVMNDKPESFVIIIDDFENIGIKKTKGKQDFLSLVALKCNNIFIFANDSMEIEAFANPELAKELIDFKVYRIKEFGHLLRDSLIHKWLIVNREEELSDAEIFEKKDSISLMIKTTVGTKYVPTHPVYLLSMLQFIDESSKLNLQGSSYVELYNYLITQALASVNTQLEDFDLVNTYLSSLAYKFYKERVRKISQAEADNFLTEYIERMDLGKKADNIHGQLLKAKILKIEDGYISFNLSFTYYYFTAKYLSEYIQSDQVREDIKGLTNTIFTSENANIILFLIHRSKDPKIIDEILSESNKIFKDTKTSTFSKEETDHINCLIEKEIRLSINGTEPNDYRKEVLKKQDNEDRENERKKVDDLDTDPKELFSQLGLSFKLIDIQGQILKNYFGSLDGNKKAEILDSVRSLGLRGLQAVLTDFKSVQEALGAQLENHLSKQKNISHDVVDKIINHVLFSFHVGLSLAFIKKIRDGVASKGLLNVIEKMPIRHDDVATLIIESAARLNFQNGLSATQIIELNDKLADNFFAKSILKFLVIEHLYKFEVKPVDKQRICSKLDISVEQNIKILGSKTRRLQ